jgi:hypothetical protein
MDTNNIVKKDIDVADDDTKNINNNNNVDNTQQQDNYSMPSRRYERVTSKCLDGAFYTYDGRKERYYDCNGDEW